MSKQPQELEGYNLNVGENEDDEEAIYRTSLVENPATRKLFAIFSEQENKNLDFKVIAPSAENAQVVAKNGKFERLVSGVWFMPDTDYLRFDGTQYFTTSMSREELKKAVKNFMKAGNSNQFDIHHDGRPVQGIRTVEVWVLEDYSQPSPIYGNKIEDLGYKKEDIPLGTVFMSVFISNEKFFKDKILSKEVKGFSIEGLFTLTKKKNESMTGFNELFAALGFDAETKTVTLADGKKLVFSNEGVLLDGKLAPNADYKTKLKKFQVVVRDGKLVDAGFEETAPAVTETPLVEKTETPSTKEADDIDAKVEAILAKKEAEKAEAAKKKAEEDEKEATRKAELEAKDKEIEELKKKVPVPKGKVSTEGYNKETHVLKKGVLVPKR